MKEAKVNLFLERRGLDPASLVRRLFLGRPARSRSPQKKHTTPPYALSSLSFLPCSPRANNNDDKTGNTMARPLLLCLLFAAASSLAAADAHPRLRKTEAFDPAFTDWWQQQAPSIAAQDNNKNKNNNNPPKLLVDAALQRRRDALRSLALDFGEAPPNPPPPRVVGADRAPSPSLLAKQHLPRASWSIDRVDRSFPPILDRFYTYNTSRQGEGVTLYTIDSGIIAEHDEFSCDAHDRRALGKTTAGEFCSRAEEGPVFLREEEDDGSSSGDPHQRSHSSSSSRDVDGHGTHVASTAIGKLVGIAKRARVVAVRVLDGKGEGTIADVISALDYVRDNARKPAVVTMSLGVPSGPWSEELESAVRRVVAEAGITVVVASGNSGVDACGIAPARVPEALTVAATDLEGGKFGPEIGGIGGGGSVLARRAGPSPSSSPGRLRDTVYAYSNTGPCVDLFAPGVEIFAACGGASRCGEITPRAMAWATGTSMAVPHIAGAAAIFLGEHPQATPEEVRRALVGSATRGALSGDGVEDKVGGWGGGGGASGAGGRLRSTVGATEEEAQIGALASTPDLTLYTRALAGDEF